jgi:hypothetical protein
MSNRRGNPSWGRLEPFPPAMATEFELQVRHLRLAPEEYVASSHLRNWCERNRNNFYIPEWLLYEWGFRVHDDLSGAA